MNSEIVNWISIIGSFASLIGLSFAYWQIYKTRRAAEAAKDASLQTQKTISRNLLISDVSTCIKYLEEIRLYIKNETFELALIRVKDLISQLIQVQEMLKSSNQSYEIDFEEIILQLRSNRNNFEKKLNKSSVKINTVRVNSQLAIISDSLNRLIGTIRIVIEKGD